MLRAALGVKEQQLNELRTANEDLKNGLAIEVRALSEMGVMLMEVSKRLAVAVDAEETTQPSWNLWG